ncbi:MAG TPA: hypothetical protein VHC20_03350, partial [Candidatus Paceibacterota bacterium]|nr:hypothetical protein [Candidatus Paceibacterota bacterium]
MLPRLLVGNPYVHTLESPSKDDAIRLRDAQEELRHRTTFLALAHLAPGLSREMFDPALFYRFRVDAHSTIRPCKIVEPQNAY